MRIQKTPHKRFIHILNEDNRTTFSSTIKIVMKITVWVLMKIWLDCLDDDWIRKILQLKTESLKVLRIKFMSITSGV